MPRCVPTRVLSSAELVSLSGLSKPLPACCCLSKCGTCRGELLALYAILNSAMRCSCELCMCLCGRPLYIPDQAARGPANDAMLPQRSTLPYPTLPYPVYLMCDDITSFSFFWPPVTDWFYGENKACRAQVVCRGIQMKIGFSRHSFVRLRYFMLLNYVSKFH
jgi:hypothetical protein